MRRRRIRVPHEVTIILLLGVAVGENKRERESRVILLVRALKIKIDI